MVSKTIENYKRKKKLLIFSLKTGLNIYLSEFENHNICLFFLFYFQWKISEWFEIYMI